MKKLVSCIVLCFCMLFVSIMPAMAATSTHNVNMAENTAKQIFRGYKSVNWSSSNSSVAVVDISTGRIKARNFGKSTVVVNRNGVKTVYRVQVYKKVANKTTTVGADIKMPNYGTVTSAVASKQGIVQLNKSTKVITGVKKGNVDLTIKYSNGKEVKMHIVVKPRLKIKRIDLYELGKDSSIGDLLVTSGRRCNVNLKQGSQVRYYVRVLPSSSDIKKLKFKKVNVSGYDGNVVLSVSKKGTSKGIVTVKAKTPGKCRIEVSGDGSNATSIIDFNVRSSSTVSNKAIKVTKLSYKGYRRVALDKAMGTPIRVTSTDSNLVKYVKPMKGWVSVTPYLECTGSFGTSKTVTVDVEYASAIHRYIIDSKYTSSYVNVPAVCFQDYAFKGDIVTYKNTNGGKCLQYAVSDPSALDVSVDTKGNLTFKCKKAGKVTVSAQYEYAYITRVIQIQ